MLRIRGPSSLELIRVVDRDGRVERPDLLEEISQTLTGEEVLNIHKEIVLNELLSQQASEDALIAREGEKRATLMIAPFSEGAAITFKKLVQPRDRICTYGRYWDVDIAAGVKPLSVMDGFYENLNRASLEDFRDHNCDLPRVPVGIQLDFAVGQALRQRVLEDGFFVVWVFFGDGATAQGYFHESMNVASILKLPVVFVCRNNQWALSTRQSETTATRTYAEKALAYNMAFLRADGNDVFATYHAYRQAREYIERTGEPLFVEFVYRRRWYHTTAVNLVPLDVPPKEIEEARLSAPLRRNRLFLLSPDAEKYFGIKWSREQELNLYLKAAGDKLFRLVESDQWKDVLNLDWITAEDEKNCADKGILKGLAQEIAETSYQGSVECLGRGEEFVAKWEELNTKPLFEPFPPETTTPYPQLPEEIGGATCLDAVGGALCWALAEDRHTILAGEDIAPGGVMRAEALRESIALALYPEKKDRILRNFLPLREIFPKQVFNTPLCENGIVGIFGTGAAQGGLRPVVVIQFDEFGLIAFDQIVEAAKEIQLKGGLTTLPLVIRFPTGAGKRINWHQKCTMAHFANLLGVVIATYSTLQDAFDITLAATRCNRPVLLYEPIEFYRPEPFLKTLGWYDPEKDEPLSYGKTLKGQLLIRPPWQPVEHFGARVAKEGENLTLVAYGQMVHHCLKAAEIIEKEDPKVSVEVVDLRIIKPLAPFALPTIIQSVKKTGCIVAVQEEPLEFGIGAEIIARVYESEELFDFHLDAHAKRVASRNAHLLLSKYVDLIVPNYNTIAAACRETLYKKFFT